MLLSYDMVWYGMIWYDMIRYGMVWQYAWWCRTLNPPGSESTSGFDDNCRRQKHAHCDGAWYLCLYSTPLANPHIFGSSKIATSPTLPARSPPGDVCLSIYVQCNVVLVYPTANGLSCSRLVSIFSMQVLFLDNSTICTHIHKYECMCVYTRAAAKNFVWKVQ